MLAVAFHTFVSVFFLGVRKGGFFYVKVPVLRVGMFFFFQGPLLSSIEAPFLGAFTGLGIFPKKFFFSAIPKGSCFFGASASIGVPRATFIRNGSGFFHGSMGFDSYPSPDAGCFLQEHGSSRAWGKHSH